MSIKDILLKFIGSKKYNKMQLYLEKDNYDFDDFQKRCVYSFIFVLAIDILFYVLGSFNLLVFLIVFLLAFPVSIASNYLYVLYKEEVRQKQISDSLSDFLLQASLFPKGSDIITVLDFISKQDFGYLSKEFRISLDQIRNGFSVESALRGITVRNKNKLLSRVINLLIIGYDSGKDMSFIFNKLSQDMLKTQSVERERYSGLAIQKYTLLISAGFLVPLVLAWVSNIVTSMDMSMFAESDVLTVSEGMVEYAKYAIYIYLFEFSVIASIFIAIIDGNWKKFIIYSLILIPLAYAIFFL